MRLPPQNPAAGGRSGAGDRRGRADAGAIRPADDAPPCNQAHLSCLGQNGQVQSCCKIHDEYCFDGACYRLDDGSKKTHMKAGDELSIWVQTDPRDGARHYFAVGNRA